MKSISENTTITLSLLLIILGGFTYVTFVAFQGNANAKTLEKLEPKLSTIDVIATDIAVIKTKLENIEHKLK